MLADNFTPRPLHLRKTTPVPIEQEAEWTPQRVRKFCREEKTSRCRYSNPGTSSPATGILSDKKTEVTSIVLYCPKKKKRPPPPLSLLNHASLHSTHFLDTTKLKKNGRRPLCHSLITLLYTLHIFWIP